MKRTLWWRLAGVGLVTLFFLWQLVPPKKLFQFKTPDGKTEWRWNWSAWLDVLRPGIDLAGGTRLVYQVESWSGGGGATNRAEDLISVLQKRIDPNGVKNLIWRAVGDDKIEIVIPRATASSALGAAAYREALTDLLSLDIKPSDIETARQFPADQRTAAFLALEKGVAGRKELLTKLADAADRLEQVQRSSATQPATQPTRSAAAALKKAREQYDSAKRAVLATNVVESDVNKVLRMTAEERATAPEGGKTPLQDLLDRYPDRAAKIRALIAVSDEWRREKQALDDPNDLKRLLRGTGKLEFFIAVAPGDISENTARAQLDALDKTGKSTDASRYLWVQADSATANKTSGVISGQRLGLTWVLVHNTADTSLKHRDQDDWKFEWARAIRDDYNRPIVSFAFDTTGGDLFHELTSKNLHKLLCAVLDGKAISIATIQSAIRTNGQITGNFSVEEVTDLASKMQAGALPGSLSKEPISEARVDAQLGVAQRRAGINAAVVALIAVLAFMLIYYLIPLGLVADIALVFNLLYTLAAMTFGFTFTLPGIAGLILTLGMAVDANVLIDERIREEQARGLGLRQAIKNGYARALTVIVDSNVTTIISAIILYLVGTTEIRGFAVTLGIGLVFSMFTSVFLTRWILQLAIEYGWLKDRVPMLRLIGVPKIRWMDKRFMFWGASAAIMVAGLAAFIVQEPRKLYDPEFIGGTKAQVTLRGDLPVVGEERIQNLIRQANAGDPERVKLLEGLTARRLELGQAADKAGQTFEFVTPSGTKEQTNAFRAALVEALSQPRDIEGFGTASLLPAGRGAIDFAEKSQWDPLAQTWRAWIATPKAQRTDEELSRRMPTTLPEGAFVITDAYMSGAGDANLDAFRNGVGIVVTGLPPSTLDSLRARIGSQLNTPEFDMLPPTQMLTSDAESATSGWQIFGLEDPTAANPQGVYTRVLYVARAEQYANPQDPAWLTRFALPEVAAVHDAFSLPQELDSLTYFSPSVASNLKLRALIAIVLAMIAVLVYVWIRFGNWLFGLGAVLPLVHDSLIVIGLVALSKFLAPTAVGRALLISDFRFDLTVVAAVLTVIGYSINDTIIVFDRIRENRGRLSYVTAQLIDNSINQTLPRTVLTNLTVFLVLLIMYIFGGQGIRAFNFAMIVGAIVGTYSSIAIAAPLLVGWSRMFQRRMGLSEPPADPSNPS